MVGRSPGGATALPPSATTMVPGGAFTAAQPSGARGWEQACGAPGRAAPSTGHTSGEALQVAGGEGRVGLRGELLRPSPPCRERRIGGRTRLATRGEQAPERGRHAPALAPVLPPGEKHRVDAGGRTSGIDTVFLSW